MLPKARRWRAFWLFRILAENPLHPRFAGAGRILRLRSEQAASEPTPAKQIPWLRLRNEHLTKPRNPPSSIMVCRPAVGRGAARIPERNVPIYEQ